MLDGFLKDAAFYFSVGGYVMPPLVGATVVLWFAIGYRFAALKRGTRRSVRALIDRHHRGHVIAGNGIIAEAVRRGIALKLAGTPDLRRHLDDAFGDFDMELKRFDRLVATIVTVAPIVGLLGTVVGMIETFESLGDMALFTQSGGIAGGISQALFTTQMGLAVAIPGLVVGRVVKRKQVGIERELAQIKDILCSLPGEAL